MTNFASEDDVSLANKSTKNNPSQSQILKKKQGCLDAFLQQKENNNQQNIEYEVPFLPFVSPMAPIPPAFRPEFPLYDHQRRSLYRMLSIEAKDEEYMKFNFGKLDYFSKGGCLADAIGMGKTATMLGLIVSEPLEEKETIGANLVIAPSHLLGQWKNEVTKFIQDNEEITIVIGLEAFEALKPDQIHNRMLVLVSVDEVLQTQTVYYSYGKIYATNPKKAGGGFSFFGEKKKKIDPLKLSEEKIQKFQSAAKYVHKAYEGTIWTSKIFFPLKKWRRVIFEEVQDLVLPGKKAYDCFIQVTRSAWNVWLVTATPFPNLKESIYANNQLLGFKRLRLEPKSEFFEKIKKKLYLRNCLQGIQDISMTGTVNTTPETTETTESTSSGTTPTGTGTTTPGTGIGTGIGIGIGTGTGTGTGISKIKIEEKYLCVPLHSKELNVYQMEMLFGENSTTSSGKSTSDSSTSTWWSEAFLSARQSCVHVGISDRILDRVPVDKKSKKKNNNNKKKKKKKNNNNNNKEEEEDDFEEEVLTTQAKDTRHVISKISQVKTPQEIFLQEKAFCQKTKYFSQEKLNEMKQIQEATKNTIEILKRIENQLLVYHGRSIAEAFEKIDENQEDENQKTTEILFSKGFRILQRHADETTYGGEFDDVLLFEKHEIKDYLLKYWFNSELVRKFRIIMETNLQENTKAIELIQRKIVLLEKCLTGTTTSTGNGTTTSVPYYGSKIACLIQYLLRLQEEKKKKKRPPLKVVVFSMWTNCLRLLEASLRVHRLRCGLFHDVQETSTGSQNKKTDVLNRFRQEKNETHILLLHGLTSASGINLQMASHVFFMDPMGFTASQGSTLEQQAIGRVVRMGQLHPKVQVVRFVAEKTIEMQLYEDIYRIHCHKKQVEKELFGAHLHHDDYSNAYVCEDFDQPIKMHSRRCLVRMGMDAIRRRRGKKTLNNTNEPESSPSIEEEEQEQEKEEEEEEEEEEIHFVSSMTLEDAINQRFEKAKEKGVFFDLTSEETTITTTCTSLPLDHQGNNEKKTRRQKILEQQQQQNSPQPSSLSSEKVSIKMEKRRQLAAEQAKEQEVALQRELKRQKIREEQREMFHMRRQKPHSPLSRPQEEEIICIDIEDDE